MKHAFTLFVALIILAVILLFGYEIFFAPKTHAAEKPDFTDLETIRTELKSDTNPNDQVIIGEMNQLISLIETIETQIYNQQASQ